MGDEDDRRDDDDDERDVVELLLEPDDGTRLEWWLATQPVPSA